MNQTHLGVFGQNDLVHFRNLRIWAERGLTHIEDAKTNGYQTVPVVDMLDRTKALSDMVGQSSRRDRNDPMDNAFRSEHRDVVEGLIGVCRKAQVQGTPDDESAARDNARRRAHTIVVPGLTEFM